MSAGLDTLPATYHELGLTRQRVAEWRQLREAGEHVIDEAIQGALDEGRAPTNAQEFTRLYFGGTASDPTSSNAANEEFQAWFRQAIAAGKPEAEWQAEMGRRVRQMMNRPMLRYADGNLYGDPVFIATAVSAAADNTQAVRYVVVFQDHALGRTGFEYHTAAVVARSK